MPLKPEAKQIVRKMIDSLTAGELLALGAETNQEIATEVVSRVKEQKEQTLYQVLEATLVFDNPDIIDWNAFEAAVSATNRTVLYPALKAFSDAMQSHNTRQMILLAMTVAVAELQHRGNT